MVSNLIEINLNNLNYPIMKNALICLLLIIVVGAKAQTYPITGITISLPANPDANTANWATGVSQLSITATGKAINGRVDGFVVESKILVIIKKNGAKICGTYTSSTAPASNFNTLTKVWSGSNAISLIGQSCVLSPGDYELSVQFFGYSNGKFNPLSDERTKAFSIRGNEQQSFQAPQLIAPANETAFKESDISKPITFRWTPVSPRPQEPVTYRLRIWQFIAGQSRAQTIIQQPILGNDVGSITQTTISNLITGPCKPPYLCDFVWNVQALGRDGKPIGANNGTSETYSFKYTGVITTVTAGTLKLISPANQSTIARNQPVRFSWTSSNSSTDNSQGYKIKIVEITGDQSPEQAFRANKPIFERDTDYIHTNKPIFEKDSTLELTVRAPFTSGKKYAWAVGETTPFVFFVDKYCDCGKWSQLQAGRSSYECNTKRIIPWKCGQAFDFKSTYQCTGTKDCQPKTRWTVSKDDKVVQEGIGTNSINGSFTPTANGTYTLTLDANCDDKECVSCSYRIVVEDCKVVNEENGCKLIRNSGFILSNIPGVMPSGSVQYWAKGYGNPIVNNDATEGFIEQGYIKLKGNANTGQAVMQSLDPTNKIIQGKKYKISVAVRFKASENTADYVRLRAVAYNGSINSNIGVHPLPSTNVAIIGRSNKIKDCGDWSVIEFPVWVANKDFLNIAFNAFTNDNTNATIWIDDVTVCETTEDECNEVQVTADGKPITPAGYGNTSTIASCELEAEDDEYYNGSLMDLYPGYNGTTDLYAQQSNSCFNIGGTLPDEVIKYSCNDSLKLAGIDMTCEELNGLLTKEFVPELTVAKILPKIPPLSNGPCDLPKPPNMANMPFGGRDIIYIHGLQMSHLIDRAKGTTGATGKWPANKGEYVSGYYKISAYNNMMPHISHFLGNRGNLNRFIVVVYDCSESAEVAIHAVLTQIRDAMGNGTGVQANRSDKRGRSCFGRDYVMISHSTGALVADVALSIANKTKIPGTLQDKYGNLGLISDRCKGRLSIQGAYSGSNLAKIAVVAQGPLVNLVLSAVAPGNIQALIANQGLIAKSILVDLVPEITRSRWGSYINDITVPVFTIASGHPSAILNVLKYSIHPGFDDGVLTMDSSNGNNNPLSFGHSRFSANGSKVFDMGIPLIRAIKYYQDQRISDGVFASASIPNLSPTGMVQPVQSVIVNPQQHFNNHFSFIQSSKEHWFNATEPGSGNTPCDYGKTFPGAAVNNEEQLVVTNTGLFNPSLIDPSILTKMGETVKGRIILYPTIKIVFRHGIPRPSIFWKTFYIWKRTYHNLIDNCMYDVDYGYSYLFKQ